MLQNFLDHALSIQFGLVFRYGTGWSEILDRRRATEREGAGVDATAIGAGQDLPDRNLVSAEGFADTLGLRYAARRKVDFFRAVSGREMPYPFSHVDMSVTHQDNLAPLS